MTYRKIQNPAVPGRFSVDRVRQVVRELASESNGSAVRTRHAARHAAKAATRKMPRR